MRKYGFFGHTTLGSDYFVVGASPGDRMVICGYPQFAAWGENLAAGYPSAATVFSAWRYSDSHNSNMLRPYVEGHRCEPGSRSRLRVGLATGRRTLASYVDGTAHEAGGLAPPDVTNPIVTITSPAEGADLSSVVSVKMTATDNLAVTRVELYVEGTLVGTDTSSPYVIAWDTSGLNPGTYGLEARAYDAAGNVGVSARSVHVSSTPGATTTTIKPGTTTTTTTPPTTTSTTTTAPPTTTTTTTASGAPFPDVRPGGQYYSEISDLAAAGVVSGSADGLYHPERSVTRAQFAKIVVLGIGAHTAAVDNMLRPSFVDVRFAGSDYPFDYVEEAAALGIIQGYADGTFRPGAIHHPRSGWLLMLVRAGGTDLAIPPAGPSFPFTDVPAYVTGSRARGLLQPPGIRQDPDQVRPLWAGDQGSSGQDDLSRFGRSPSIETCCGLPGLEAHLCASTITQTILLKR